MLYEVITNRILVLAAMVLFLSPAFAQDEPNQAELEVVLPPDAQKCVLPASPDKIPEDATLDQLKVAKGQVASFHVITSYSIHYTKLYDIPAPAPRVPAGHPACISRRAHDPGYYP